jgi:hypothetical protein
MLGKAVELSCQGIEPVLGGEVTEKVRIYAKRQLYLGDER